MITGPDGPGKRPQPQFPYVDQRTGNSDPAVRPGDLRPARPPGPDPVHPGVGRGPADGPGHARPGPEGTTVPVRGHAAVPDAGQGGQPTPDRVPRGSPGRAAVVGAAGDAADPAERGVRQGP